MTGKRVETWEELFADEGGGAQGEFDPPDLPSVLDADIDTEGANAGWTGAPTPAPTPDKRSRRQRILGKLAPRK